MQIRTFRPEDQKAVIAASSITWRWIQMSGDRTTVVP